jgi:outer membrane protein TolC
LVPWRGVLTLTVAALAVTVTAGAQGAPAAQAPPASSSPVAGERPGLVRVTFDQAIAMAVEHNPSVAQAAQAILQAQALLNQATALIKPKVVGGVTVTVLNTGTSINGVTASAQTQAAGTVTASAPLIAPVQWALRVQASDSKHVAELAAADVRKQVAVSTAEACLAIVALRQVLDADLRARNVAKDHYEDAKERRIAGSGTKLNELRAQQSLSADQALVETSQTNLYQAQEALGVLIAAEGPADLIGEPALAAPPSIDAAVGAMAATRTDLRLLSGRERAAARILSDSWKDWLPSVNGLFTPEVVQPATLFQHRFTWEAQIVATIPIFDSGFRSAQKAQRQVGLETVKIAEGAAMRQAQSDVRTARDSLEATERALGFAREAASEAHQVVEMVLVSFHVGASTNIEVIDAQRVALDADTSVALADHDVRQARLNLLVALGLFPGNSVPGAGPQ